MRAPDLQRLIGLAEVNGREVERNRNTGPVTGRVPNVVRMCLPPRMLAFVAMPRDQGVVRRRQAAPTEVTGALRKDEAMVKLLAGVHGMISEHWKVFLKHLRN